MLLDRGIGQQFDGLVTGASEKGVWVRIRRPVPKDGLVRGLKGWTSVTRCACSSPAPMSSAATSIHPRLSAVADKRARRLARSPTATATIYTRRSQTRCPAEFHGVYIRHV